MFMSGFPAGGRHAAFVRRTVMAASIIATFAACRETMIEDRWPRYRVEGRVTGPTGSTVASATVWLWVYDGPACEDPEVASGPYTTDQGGFYEGSHMDFVGVFSGCIEARVTPPTGAGLDAGSRRIGPVDLVSGDKVTIDGQLESPPE